MHQSSGVAAPAVRMVRVGVRRTPYASNKPTSISTRRTKTASINTRISNQPSSTPDVPNPTASELGRAMPNGHPWCYIALPQQELQSVGNSPVPYTCGNTCGKASNTRPTSIDIITRFGPQEEKDQWGTSNRGACLLQHRLGTQDIILIDSQWTQSERVVGVYIAHPIWVQGLQLDHSW